LGRNASGPLGIWWLEHEAGLKPGKRIKRVNVD
jgi:hypothetical protein